MTQLLKVGQGLLINESSNSHSDVSPAIGLLWTRDRPITENST